MGSEELALRGVTSSHGMEAALTARDRVGVQDLVLLEDYKSVSSFVENLKKRFGENLIYTYIGPVLISVNPYKPISVYSERIIETYRNVNFYELPPHIYAIGDAAYRSMRSGLKDQCVLISGESGSGKTEASKKILQYIAASSSHSDDVTRVKDRLLQSNPILEAFGNAKTNRNDNSSRFGKYMDVEFDFTGAPVGGVVLNYLLEKSRVVHQALGERNFHIFYQLVKGSDPGLREELALDADPHVYFYLKQGGSEEADRNDVTDFAEMRTALDVCDFAAHEQKALFSIIAFILHLGNVTFDEDDRGHALVEDADRISIMAKLIQCSSEQLTTALTNRSIVVEGKKVTSPLMLDQGVYARDALGKGVYERLFKWLVNKVNVALAKKTREKTNVLGLLDIYGFEIFEINSFEQFCINYCNEKLQQIFVTLTLKSEQEEYQNEGIEWEAIQYFNNKIICDLVESKPVGIIAILDEECLRPGTVTDKNFLEKMSSRLGDHPHYLSYETAEIAERKNIKRDEFRLLHYAGEVTYKVQGFLDKNNDLLYRDLKEVMSNTQNEITQACFPSDELSSRRRPDTAGMQFKASLGQLMTILLSKEPSYIRCIKPNEDKQPNIFNEQIVRHQVKYLGLMENLRVRRAGFAYRREYPVFLHRYKSLCPDTWPVYQGSDREGVAVLCRHLQYEEEDYSMGRTKIFIRFPRVLFATEDALQKRKHELATVISARFRGYIERKRFLIKKHAATKIASVWKMYKAKKLLVRRRKAAHVIRRYIKGFILRNQVICEENRLFITYMRYNFLMQLRNKLPKSVLDKAWPAAPSLLQESSDLLRTLYMGNMVRRYTIKLTPARKTQLEQKVVAERVFKGKKENYPQSIGNLFENTRLNDSQQVLLKQGFSSTIKQASETIQYSSLVTKYDRHGYQPRQRVLVVTSESVYILGDKDLKVKERIAYVHLKGVSVSRLSDTVFVLHIDTQQKQNATKGDFVLSSPFIYEAVVKIVLSAKNESNIQFTNESISHFMPGGKQGLIEFTKGPRSSVAKSKKGLLVTALAT